MDGAKELSEKFGVVVLVILVVLAGIAVVLLFVDVLGDILNGNFYVRYRVEDIDDGYITLSDRHRTVTCRVNDWVVDFITHGGKLEAMHSDVCGTLRAQ